MLNYIENSLISENSKHRKTRARALSEKILQVHIKDYPYRKLGEGNINFHDVISSLKKISFDGYLIL